MVESEGFKPVPLTLAWAKLSSLSRTTLERHGLSLSSILEMHPNLVCIWNYNDCQFVSCPQSPWLGPGRNPPLGHVAPGPPRQEYHLEDGLEVFRGVPRGKALEMISEMANTSPIIQNVLAEIVQCLMEAPSQTMLVSELGNRCGADTRNFLKAAKLRIVQLLRSFPDDFLLLEEGPGTMATYRHTIPKDFASNAKPHVHNSTRLARALKLAADLVIALPGAQPISARELRNESPGRYLLVDCRSATERKVSTLPGAVDVEDLRVQDFESWELVVAFDCIGCRAAKWCHEISRARPDLSQKMKYLFGGVVAWAHDCGQFTTQAGADPCNKVHGWTWELVSLFPLDTGLEVLLSGIGPGSNAADSAGPWLESASRVRHSRLVDLAWEVRLRYCPSSLCLEAGDLKRELTTAAGVAVASTQTPLLRPPATKSMPLVVDIRTENERAVSTIAGMGCPVVDEAEFRARARELIYSSAIVCVICTVGGRSGMFCERAVRDPAELGLLPTEQELLLRKLSNVLGGIAAWLHHGGGLVDPEGRPTRRVHPWCTAFVDLFPIEGLELVFEDLGMPRDAKAIAECGCVPQDVSPSTNLRSKLLRTYQMLAPEALADTLTRAAENCGVYED